jgi:hypothetical protein
MDREVDFLFLRSFRADAGIQATLWSFIEANLDAAGRLS